MQIDRQVQLKMLPTRMCSWYLVRQKEDHDDVSSADLPSQHDKRDSNRPVNSVVSAVLMLSIRNYNSVGSGYWMIWGD